MCLCEFGQNPPTGSEDESADKKLRGQGCLRDPHQKQYVPPPLRLGEYKSLDSYFKNWQNLFDS